MNNVKLYREKNYTSRDFDSIMADLEKYIKLYFPNNDFSPLSTGRMLAEIAAYLADNLAFMQDVKYNEIFNPVEKKNAINLLKLFGGKYHGKTASNVKGMLYIVVPAAVSGGEVQVDEDYLPIIKRELIASTDNNKQFISVEDVDFRDESGREISIYSTDDNGTPLYFVIRKPVLMKSGTISTFNYTVEDPVSFLKIELPSSHNVLEIISVIDSNNENWYEVDYLAQDEVYLYEYNQNVSTKYDTPLLLRKIKVPKRFITETNQNNVTSLIFGSSNGNLESGIVYPGATRFVVNTLSDNMGTFSFNNNLLLNSGSLGLSPANTTLTIKYLYGGGTEYNINAKDLNSIVSSQMIFQKSISLLDSTKLSNTRNSLTISNTENAIGGVDELTVEDIKQLIPVYYSSQKRAVTLEDYYSLVYSMPVKFGNVYRVLAVKDNNDSNSIALYILSIDRENNLSTANYQLKINLKTYLSKFKMITDNINIYDGEIVNFGINYDLIIDENQNKYEIMEKVNTALVNYFNNKLQFGEPLYYNKVLKLIDDVEGVITVSKLEFYNKTGNNYSSTNFNFKQISNGIISPGFNQILELKFNADISGNVIN